MRILYVRRREGPREAGDAVVDRRLLAELRVRMFVDELELDYQNTPLTLKTALVQRIPPSFARIRSTANAALVDRKLAEGDYDAVLFSHEATVPATLPTNLPTIVVTHNVQSRRFADGSPSARLLGPVCRAVERRFFQAADLVGFLAADDLTAGVALGTPSDRALLLAPGMPPGAPMLGPLPFLATYLVTGTYGWHLKTRALRRFARSFGGFLAEREVFVTDRDARATLGTGTLTSLDALRAQAGLRLGLVIDDFHMGFKLKSLEYVALNAVVVFRNEVPEDFVGLPFAERFVRSVDGPPGLVALESEFQAADPRELEQAFRQFQAACIERFDWQRSGRLLGERLLALAPAPAAA